MESLRRQTQVMRNCACLFRDLLGRIYRLAGETGAWSEDQKTTLPPPSLQILTEST